MLQIVYETLKDIQEHKGMSKNTGQNKTVPLTGFKMSVYDRTPAMGKLF